jgi:sialidase-1
MASLISANVKIEGTNRQALFFSNPNNKNSRTNMTIKASLDGGLTWHEKYWTELNETDGYGYSCMTMTDGKTVGILYEGVKELYFQKVPVKDIFGE